MIIGQAHGAVSRGSPESLNSMDNSEKRAKMRASGSLRDISLAYSYVNVRKALDPSGACGGRRRADGGRRRRAGGGWASGNGIATTNMN
mgnify:CR=1 FL=1